MGAEQWSRVIVCVWNRTDGERRRNENINSGIPAKQPLGGRDTEVIMLRWAAIFFVIALIAAVFGFGGIAAGAAEIAKILFFIFLVIFVIALIMGLVRR